MDMCSHPWGQMEESNELSPGPGTSQSLCLGSAPPGGQSGQEHGTMSLSQAPWPVRISGSLLLLGEALALSSDLDGFLLLPAP